MLEPAVSRYPSSRARAAPLLLLSACLFALAVIELLLARRYWRDRIPAAWEWRSSFVGVSTPPAANGRFPAQDVTVIYDRNLRVVDERQRPGHVVVSDSYINREPRTGKVLYDYTVRFRVDPRTGRHLPPFERDHLLFPRHTQRRTYSMRITYLKGVPLAFRRVEEVEGLQVYRFGYSGRMEYTDFYRGTPEVPGMAIPPDREIRCFEDQYRIDYWVEPTTGIVVKLAERCRSADVLQDRATGAFRANVLRWSAESTGNDVVAKVEDAWKKRAYMLATLRYIPLALAALGLLLGGFWLNSLRRRVRREPA